MKIKVFTAFSGYDSQCMALEKAGIDYDLVGWSEIDKYAIQAHDAVFPQFKDRNYGDISKIDWNDVPDFDLFTYSSPCQDFSIAGKMRGGQEGSGTRSSLLWICKEAIRIKRPKYCILENVENLVSDKFYNLFCQWEQMVAGLGYNNFWKVVNSLDCGVPQNRKRVFLVSILDHDQYFEFPEKKATTKKLEDYLEKKVDATNYIPADKVDVILDNQPNKDMLLIRNATEDGFIGVRKGGLFDFSYPKSKSRRGRSQGDCGDICPTLTTHSLDNLLRFEGYKKGKPILRRLTGTELFRLMGVTDKNITRIQEAGVGIRQQGNLAGNSICVDVLEGIFKNLFIGCEKPEDYLF